jgi:hypothetical protein
MDRRDWWNARAAVGSGSWRTAVSAASAAFNPIVEPEFVTGTAAGTVAYC